MRRRGNRPACWRCLREITGACAASALWRSSELGDATRAPAVPVGPVTAPFDASTAHRAHPAATSTAGPRPSKSMRQPRRKRMGSPGRARANRLLALLDEDDVRRLEPALEVEPLHAAADPHAPRRAAQPGLLPARRRCVADRLRRVGFRRRGRVGRHEGLLGLPIILGTVTCLCRRSSSCRARRHRSPPRRHACRA